ACRCSRERIVEGRIEHSVGVPMRTGPGGRPVIVLELGRVLRNSLVEPVRPGLVVRVACSYLIPTEPEPLDDRQQRIRTVFLGLADASIEQLAHACRLLQCGPAGTHLPGGMAD